MTGDDGAPGSALNRGVVVDTALQMLDEVGSDGLSMRALAGRMGVKAASLYWHIRDKEQLLEFIAEALLDRADVRSTPGGWRAQVTAACDRLQSVVLEHGAATEVLLSSPAVVQRSRLVRDLAHVLASAGLAGAAEAAFSLVVQVVAAASVAAAAAERPGPDASMRVAIDSGSWRVTVRGGAPGMGEVARSVGGGGAPHIEARPDGEVVVRNRRGGRRGAVELNPEHTWYVKVHGGTWNTSLDLSSLRISGIELDSGAGNVTCLLPAPHGVVPLRVNSGIVNVNLTRPAGTAAHALVSTGSVKVRLDGAMVRASAADVTWDSPGASGAPDCYDLTVCSGCVKVTLDTRAGATSVAAVPPAARDSPQPAADVGVGLILDGIAARLDS